MDLRRLRAGEWIAAIAGAVLVVSLFLPWYSTEGSELSALEAYAIVDVLLFAVGVLGILLLVITATQRTAAVGVASDALLTIVSTAVFVVAAIRAINLPGDLESAGADRATFLFVGLAAVFGVLAGALIAMRDERLSGPGEHTDATGRPVDAPPPIETLPAPPRGSGDE